MGHANISNYCHCPPVQCATTVHYRGVGALVTFYYCGSGTTVCKIQPTVLVCSAVSRMVAVVGRKCLGSRSGLLGGDMAPTTSNTPSSPPSPPPQTIATYFRGRYGTHHHHVQHSTFENAHRRKVKQMQPILGGDMAPTVLLVPLCLLPFPPPFTYESSVISSPFYYQKIPF